MPTVFLATPTSSCLTAMVRLTAWPLTMPFPTTMPTDGGTIAGGAWTSQTGLSNDNWRDRNASIQHLNTFLENADKGDLGCRRECQPGCSSTALWVRPTDSVRSTSTSSFRTMEARPHRAKLHGCAHLDIFFHRYYRHECSP